MAKNVVKVKEETLETILFNCRDYLRGKAQMTDKRDLLLTLVFIKFLGDRFNRRREQIAREVRSHGIDNEDFIKRELEKPNQYQQEGVFFLSEECQWDKLLEVESKQMALAFDNCIAKLETIEVGRDANGNPVRPLKNALPQQIFTKTALEAGVLKKVCDEINKIDPKKFHESDLIGRVYEYFLQAFSINADKEEGEFYTPHSIVELIASHIEPYDGTIYDPACGSGGMFVQSLKMIAAHGGNTKAVSVYGQESEPATYRLCKMNLAIRGISYNLGEKAVSTFTDDQHKDMKMDYIMANPPFNLKKWRGEEELLDDPRWSGYGVPPVSNANYGWILHILNKLNVTKGVAGFLLANGALDDSDTLAIRRRLIENDKVEAIVVLPRQMFYTTDISVTLWILNNNKHGGIHGGRILRNREGEVLFIDLRRHTQGCPVVSRYIHRLYEVPASGREEILDGSVHRPHTIRRRLCPNLKRLCQQSTLRRSNVCHLIDGSDLLLVQPICHLPCGIPRHANLFGDFLQLGERHSQQPPFLLLSVLFHNYLF